MTEARRQLRVLHLASFAGNIGDIANHAGARAMFAEHLPFDMQFTELEIREFYWRQRAFDADFVRWANTFDLLIIGGGNYFELWVTRSATGTSIDIEPELFSQLTVPTLFYSLGVDIGQGYTTETAGRFKRFMDTILESPRAFVCVRNDGSSRALGTVLGAAYREAVPVMPDGGFFLPVPESAASSSGPRITVNLAGDMLDQRFRAEGARGRAVNAVAAACIAAAERDRALRLHLVPHIWRDVAFLGELLEAIPDALRRRQVVVSALDPSVRGLGEFVRTYSESSVVLGMRFHANVCPIGMTVPTLGLVCYPQVALLYDELGLQDRALDTSAEDFGDRLDEQLTRSLVEPDAVRSRLALLRTEVRQSGVRVLGAIARWLDACKV